MEDNKVIDNFMDIVYVPEDSADYMQWNNLVPVVEKINELGYQFLMNSGRKHSIKGEELSQEAWPTVRCEFFEHNNHSFVTEKANSMIEATYKAVVEFIKWYNKQ